MPPHWAMPTGGQGTANSPAGAATAATAKATAVPTANTAGTVSGGATVPTAPTAAMTVPTPGTASLRIPLYETTLYEPYTVNDWDAEQRLLLSQMVLSKEGLNPAVLNGNIRALTEMLFEDWMYGYFGNCTRGLA